MHVNRILSSCVPWVGVLWDAPNADGGAGGAGSTGSEAPSTGADGSAGADGTDAEGSAAGGRQPADAQGAAATAEETIDDLLDAEDDPLSPLDSRLKAVSGRNKKLGRKVRAWQPIIERVKDLDLDTTLREAQAYRELQELASTGDPGARRRLAQLVGLDDYTPADRAAATTDETPDPIDLKNLPFEPKENDGNAFIYRLAETVNAQARELRALKAGVDAGEKRSAQTAATMRKQTWGDKLGAALGQIQDPGIKMLLKDAVYGAFRDNEARIARGERPYAVDFILNRYLKQVGASKDTQQRARDAVRQTTAQKTASLTKPVSTTTSAPATAAGDKKFGLAEARARITSMAG